MSIIVLVPSGNISSATIPGFMVIMIYVVIPTDHRPRMIYKIKQIDLCLMNRYTVK